ncbi:MAG: DsbA family oxidoreductase [Pseudomonadota bacterium]
MSGVPVTVFTDYICPFCYVGDRRLRAVAQVQPLAIDWRFIEIHPDNPPAGRPVAALGYPPAQWRVMMDNLRRMAEAEGLVIAERTFTTNSRRALLLAEAVRVLEPERFDAVDEALFAAFFAGRRNIADPAVLAEVAAGAGVGGATVAAAQTDPRFAARLQDNHRLAARLGVTGTPTFVVGARVLAGAVPTATLAAAVREAGGQAAEGG